MEGGPAFTSSKPFKGHSFMKVRVLSSVEQNIKHKHRLALSVAATSL